MMRQGAEILHFDTRGRGFLDITARVASFANEQRLSAGLLTLFCRHTSASLLIQENADPNVLHDLETFFASLVPEGEGHYEHDTEGPDDMPAHIRAALTQTHLAIPIIGGALTLGTWQGLYLVEHRRRGHRREVAAHVVGE